jgi:hypothetical protein
VAITGSSKSGYVGAYSRKPCKRLMSFYRVCNAEGTEPARALTRPCKRLMSFYRVCNQQPGEGVQHFVTVRGEGHRVAPVSGRRGQASSVGQGTGWPL